MGICKFSNVNSSYHDPHVSENENYNLGYDLKKGTVVVFVESRCKKSERVLGLLQSVNIKPSVHNISTATNQKALRKALSEHSGTSSAPFVFIVSKYFGGLNEVEKGITNHTIQKMVNSRLESIGSKFS